MTSVGKKIFIYVLFLVYKISYSLVPKICVNNVTSIDKVCCPARIGSSIPCGGPVYGRCSPIHIHQDRVEPILLRDDRLNWPIRFFKKMCRCEGNFYGIACEKCWYGWEGENCDRKSIITRRNIHSFSKLEKKRFLQILHISYSSPSEFMILDESDSEHSDSLRNPNFIQVTFQQYIAYVHHYASRSTFFEDEEMCEQHGYLDYNHNSVSFATWHRALMLYWERELAKIALKEFNWKDFAIPYWDWVDATECEVCNNHLVGATGDYDPVNEIWPIDIASPFHNWTEYCSPPDSRSNCVGCHFRTDFPQLNRKFTSNDFPKTEDLQFVLRHSLYYQPENTKTNDEICRAFHLALEGICGRSENGSEHFHNKIHNMIHGSMCCSVTAANDPLFILHHSQMDRIIECWFRIFSPSITQLPIHGMDPGSSRESNVVGLLPPIKHGQMFTKMINLGIEYENLNFGKKRFDCLKMAHWIREHKF